MEGDSEKTKISYFHHWINGEGMGHIESWKDNKTLIHQSEYDRLEEHQKEGKYSSEQIESYFILLNLFLGMNSQQARDKAINLMNEEGKELTVEFLMNQLAVEDCNAHHKSLSQLDSTTSINFATYDHRQNKGKSSKQK